MKKRISIIVLILLNAVALLAAIPGYADAYQARDELVDLLVGHIRQMEAHFTVDYFCDYRITDSELSEVEQLVLYSEYGSNIQSYGMNAVFHEASGTNPAYNTIEFFATYYTTPEQEEVLNQKIREIIASLSLTGKAPSQQAFAIYNYIATICAYDYDVGELSSTAYAALVDNYAVCEGFASAYTRLLDAVGIESHVITGEKNGVGHAWNAVKIGDTYYYCDVTSDLDALTYKHFMRGQDSYTEYTASFVYQYLIPETAGEDIDAVLKEWNGFRYSVSNGGIQIKQFVGNTDTLTIPSQINGFPVSQINRYAIQNSSIRNLILEEGIQAVLAGFVANCEALENITLPSTVRLINLSGSAFVSFADCMVENCPNLSAIHLAQSNPHFCMKEGILYNAEMTEIIQIPAKLNREVVTIPEGVTKISSSAFEYNPYLKKIVLPDTVTYIGYWAFSNCVNLEEINIPNGCSFLGQYFIMNTAVTHLNIPASVHTIMEGAFTGAPLVQITVAEENPWYDEYENAIYSVEESTLLFYPFNAHTKTVHIKPGTKYIGMYAFKNNSYVEEVVFNPELQSIGSSAFEGCINLKKVLFPEGLQNIEECAFMRTALSGEIVLPKTLHSFGQSWQVIPGSVFWDTSVSAVTVQEPNPYFTSVDGCLYNDDCSMLIYVPNPGRVFTIPDCVKRIGSWAIRDVESLVIPECVCHFDDNALFAQRVIGVRSSASQAYAEACGIPFYPLPLAERTLVLPANLLEIQDHAFTFNSSIESVILPDGCSSIGTGAFQGCRNLLQVTIPSSVSTIPDDVFNDCSEFFLILAPEGSCAEAYAANCGIPFIPIT